MKTGTVKFSKEFITPIGLKEWLTLEWPIDEPFDEERAMKTFTKVKDFVCNYQPNGQVIIDGSISPAPPTILPVIDKAEERRIGIMADDIMSCQDLTTLDSYKLLVKGKLVLETAYNTRREQIIYIEKQGILDRTNALIRGNNFPNVKK